MRKILPFLFVISMASSAFAAKQYTHIRLGNSSDVTAATTAGAVLMGGGTDVDAAFQWMCNRSGNGDFLVIRAKGTDAYNPYILQLCPNLNSVSTLIIPNRTAASDPFVVSAIQHAEALWIAGGDQSDYLNYWKGTPVQTALQGRIDQGVPVGGTSAGMDVLSQFIYSAETSKGATSEQALANPFDRTMTFDRDFVGLSFLQGVLGDTHFVTRDRMGRNLGFMCRVHANGWSAAPKSIAVDEGTALLVSNNTATVVGTSKAYFMKAQGGPQVCVDRTALTYTNIGVYRIDASGTFDLNQWTGTGGSSYTVSANGGVLSSTQAGGSAY